MGFDVGVITKHAPALLDGALVTIQITILAFILGYAIGILMAVAALLPGRLPKIVVAAYVGTFRSVPFIITLFVIYYGLPFADIRLPAFMVGVVALAVFSGAYYTEIIRAAVQAVPRGQFDSARAVGMTYPQAMRHVIGPQVVRSVIPASTNTTLSMMKESAVLSSITIGELTYQGLIVQGETFAPFEVFAAVAVLYWTIAIAIAAAARWVEIRAGRAETKAVLRSRVAARYLSLDWRVRR